MAEIIKNEPFAGLLGPRIKYELERKGINETDQYYMGEYLNELDARSSIFKYGMIGSAAMTGSGLANKLNPGLTGGNTGAVEAASKGWKVGDDIYKSTAKGNEPAWNTVKSRFWKNEAAKPSAVDQYGADNVREMQKGNAPQRYNTDKRGMESMELSHEPIPQMGGGKDFVPRWPQDHARFDPYRRPGY